MKKSREQLEKDISNALTQKLSKRRELQRIIKLARDRFHMPERISSDYITMRKNIAEADTFELFIITYLLFKDKLSEYYTLNEIEWLSHSKYVVETAEFPLRFDMTKINDEQYIGHISVKQLMLLRDAQLINYNENAQRTMKHIVRGEMEYFQIALNKEAVHAIMESYNSDLYIPNTITLNLPEDADYNYDEKKHQLVIKKTDYLDILDGYHRYIAMSKIHSLYPEFDYDMELRVVQFTEDKARRFIWQEDQKTKMRKIDSESMDSAKTSNKIVERLNNDSSFILSGQISRNKGIINAAYFSDAIDKICLKGIKKSEELIQIKNITKSLKDFIDDFVSENPDYLKITWGKVLIFTIVYEYKYGKTEDIIDHYVLISKEDILAGPSINQADITRTHKLLGKEGY